MVSIAKCNNRRKLGADICIGGQASIGLIYCKASIPSRNSSAWLRKCNPNCSYGWNAKFIPHRFFIEPCNKNSRCKSFARLHIGRSKVSSGRSKNPQTIATIGYSNSSGCITIIIGRLCKYLHCYK